MRQDWPLGTILVLAPLPQRRPALGCMPGLVTAEWGLDRLSEIAELLVSELVTNSVRI